MHLNQMQRQHRSGLGKSVKISGLAGPKSMIPEGPSEVPGNDK